jgi:ribosomal protein S13
VVHLSLFTICSRNCRALRSLSHAGADGFHWRVCIEDKPHPGGLDSLFSWWDIQDENARLPVKEATMSHMEKMFMPDTFPTGASSDTSNKGAKGALKSFGKVLQSAVEVGTHGGNSADNGPRIPTIAFKLLDLGKMHHDFIMKHGVSGTSGGISHVSAPTPRAPRPRPVQSTPAPRSAPQPVSQQRPPPTRAPPPRTQSNPVVPQATPARPAATPQYTPQRNGEPSLMDFGATPTHGHGTLHRAATSPASLNPNETRVEKLKREYAKNDAKSNRVWDDIDQRWIEIDSKAGLKAGTTSAPPEAATTNTSNTKTVGITLDASNAIGKSANVQAAVHKRVNEMKESQAKAIQELKEREAKKKFDDETEDDVRKRLEPKIKAWSEEHGQKKQLRALLGTLHVILWPGANWKAVGLGDLLDDAKCKKVYHKATRVVHPDKTISLEPEHRFLAKRVFDALSQAKTKFDEGSS